MEGLDINLQQAPEVSFNPPEGMQAAHQQEASETEQALDLDLSDQGINAEPGAGLETTQNFKLSAESTKTFGLSLLSKVKEYFSTIDVKKFKDFFDFSEGENIDLNDENQKFVNSTCLSLFLQLLVGFSLSPYSPRTHFIMTLLALPAYFYASYLAGIKYSYLRESTATVLNMGVGALVGILSGQSGSILGFLFGSYCCVLGVFFAFYFAKNENGAGISPRTIKIYGASGAFIGAGLIFSILRFDLERALMLVFVIIYGIQVVGILVDRINMYSLDLESKNAGPSRLALALPYEAITRLAKVPLRSD